MMASSACDTVMTFTDRLFLSKLGTAQMNAALCGGLMSFLMNTFFLGLIGYGTALVAQFLGSGQKRNCPVVITQTAIIAVLAYPIILLFAPLVRSAFRASGIAPEQLVPQTIFFNILIYASIVGLLRSVFSCFFSGIGRTRIVMVASLVAMVVNIGVNYVLVLGHFGVHSMGIRGSAYGTITGGVCGLLILAAAYFFGKTHREYDVRDSFRFDFDVMRKLLRFGYPAGLEFFLNLGAFTVMVTLFDTQGQIVATAATVTFNWDMVAFIPLIGIEIAVTSLVGRYMGARQPDKAHNAAMSGIKIGSVFSIIMFALFVLVPYSLINIFRPEVNDAVFTKALPLTLFMVRLIAVYVFSEAMMVAFTGALRGAGDTFWAMSVSVCLHWLMVAILFVLFKVIHTSAEVAWVTMISWILLFSFVFYLRYRSGKWREIKVIHDPGTDMMPAHEAFHEQADI
ncbi:MAG: MATE family efflux transporter [Armatimonadota bacterium]|nr:MATE family efflux transporter [bacterium]